MKRIAILLSLLAITFSAQAQHTDSLMQETTLIFVRHAEKMDDGTKNPSLSEAGRKRAVRLANLMMKEYSLSAVYSTLYKRTLETAKPIADSLGIEVIEYNLDDPHRLMEHLIQKYAGQEVLIVGHSNTTPMFVNMVLGAGAFDKLDEDSYNEIFIVEASSIGRGCAEKITY